VHADGKALEEADGGKEIGERCFGGSIGCREGGVPGIGCREGGVPGAAGHA
jgi:hypothetical protein